MKPTVYLTGYGGKEPRELLALAASLDNDAGPTLLVDIRYWPWGKKRMDWHQDSLLQAFGERYVHLREFGNAARFEEQRTTVQLLDYDCGLTRLRSLMETGRNLLLFCSCFKPDLCHRGTVALNLKVDEIETKEAKWLPPPPGHYWDRARKVMVLDRLATAEAWAAKHPERMDATRLAKLEAVRADYDDTRNWIVWHLEGNSRSRETELIVEELPAWSREMNLREDTVNDVLRRMERAGTIEQDYSGADGVWWHWYTLSTGETDARPRRRRGSDGAGGEAGGDDGRAVQPELVLEDVGAWN